MKFIASKRNQRVTNFALAALLVVSTLTASVPFIFSQNAHAASTVTVTAANTQGWITDDTRANGHVSFVADSSNGTAGALSMKTDAAPVAGQDKAQYMHYFTTPIAFNSVTGTLGFDTKQNSAIFSGGTPSYQIPVFLNGTTGSNFATLVYEPYVDQGNAAIVNGIWQHWSINYTTSKFYSSKTFTGQGGDVVASQGSSTYTLDQIKQFFPNAVVLGYGLNVGSNNPGYDTEADNFTFNDTTYNFDYTSLSAPTNLKPVDNAYTSDPSFDNTWDAVAGAVKYEYTASYNIGGNPQTYTDTSDAGNYVLGGSTITRHNSGAPNSTYTWKVRAYDTNGIAGAWSVEQKVTVDTITPTKPILALPSNGSYLKTNEFDFDWNDSSDASPVTYEFQASQDPSRDSNNVLNGSNIWHSGVLSTSTIHSSGAGNGAWFYQVRAKDAAGNYSQWSDIWSVTIDTVAPTVIFTFPPRGSSATSFQVKFSEAVNESQATDPSSYFLTNWPGAGGSGNLSGHADVTYDAATNTATVHFTTPGWYVSGEQLWGVGGVSDLAGNVMTTISALSSPNVAPTTPGIPTTTTPTKELTSNWTWTPSTDVADPPADASGLKGYEYALTNQGVAPASDAWTFTTDTSVTTAVSGQGTYELHVRAIDNAGNTSGESKGTVVVDTTPPTVTISAPANGTTVGNNEIVTIDGSTGDSASYTLSIGKTGQVPVASTSGTSFTSYDWNTTNVASGNYIATLTGTDAVGNPSTAEVVITVDNTAPAITITPQTDTSGNQPTITGTVDDVNATLIASFNGTANIPVTNNAGNFSFTVPSALANGSYAFSIAATDTEGNISTQAANVIVNVIAPATTPVTTVTPIITNPAAAAVLGATTDNTANGDTGVKGATDVKNTAVAVNSDANKGQIFGIAWFWWILILAVIAGIAWFIAAAVRRRGEANS
ncbi:MAG: hypothetical protein JWO99_160 [Candidatus Saccharibacteria bacterium]|nr:hypothetical protein [Candidatus Saccharibacteria bacterium]